MEYNWAAYYKKEYENEKRKNAVLIGKVADAEEKYAEICADSLYRMIRRVYLFVKGAKKIADKTERLLQISVRAAANGCRIFGGRKASQQELLVSYQERLASYQERLISQMDSYERWIEEEEPGLWKMWEGLLGDEKNISYNRKCLVISYKDMAGITAVSQITGNVALQGEERPDILLFAEEPKELDERAISYIERWFSTYPEIKLFYGAQDHNVEGKREFPWFKPCWSPDTMLGFFYFGSYFAVDRAWAEKTLPAGYEDARQNLYDFMLRLTEPYFMREKNLPGQFEAYEEKEGAVPPEIAYTDLILYHKQSAASFTASIDEEHFLHTSEMRREVNTEFWGYEKTYEKIKRDLVNNICYKIKCNQGEGAPEFCAASYQTVYPEVWAVVPTRKQESMHTAKTLVSVIIPSKDHPELLKNCIGSFLERTNMRDIWGTVEFIIVDNGSNEENRQCVQTFLDSLPVENRYLYRPMPFNFSVMCNMGVKEAQGEFILLLNDDIEIIEENWLRILLGQAILPGVGAVGAKLWYPEGGKIQHAGVTNISGGPAHKLTTFPDDRTYYYGHNTITYDMIGVTAACLLVNRALYKEVSGLDEDIAVAYNDVDFCFKLAEAGYRNVVRNDAALLHHESLSRGLDGESEEKWARLLHEKAKLYKKHPLFLGYDPYYSKQLAGDALDYRIGYHYSYEDPFLTVLPERREGKNKLAKRRSNAVRLTVERLGSRQKLTLEEPDILEMEGWCYLFEQDNALLERFIILEAEREDFYYQMPAKERIRSDVEAVFWQQKNIALSGFLCRILKEDIAFGGYIVGVLYRDELSGKLYYGRSEKRLDIERAGT